MPGVAGILHTWCHPPRLRHLALILQRLAERGRQCLFKRETDRLLTLSAPSSTDIAKLGSGVAATQERGLLRLCGSYQPWPALSTAFPWRVQLGQAFLRASASIGDRTLVLSCQWQARGSPAYGSKPDTAQRGWPISFGPQQAAAHLEPVGYDRYSYRNEPLE